jgi:hypothetical protein
MNNELKILKMFMKTSERMEALSFVISITGFSRPNTGKDDDCDDELLMIWNEVNVIKFQIFCRYLHVGTSRKSSMNAAPRW